MKRKIVHKFAVVFISLFLLTALGFGYYRFFMYPQRGRITSFEDSAKLDTVLSYSQAKEDIDYLYRHLKSRHPAWLDGSDNLTEAVKQQYEKEIMNLGDTVTVLQLWQAAGRITATLHDGHTWVEWENPGDWYYINDFSQRNYYGEPISIDGIPTEDVYKKYLTMVSYELDFYAAAKFANVIYYEPLLRMCGVDTSDGVDIAFNTPDGEKTYHYSFVPFADVQGNDKKESDDWAYFSIDKEKNLGVFTLKKCICNDEYKQILDDFFNEVFADGITNIAVDLRGNGGGNSMVANEFLKHIDIDSYNEWDSEVRCGWYLMKFRDNTVANQKKEHVFSGKIYVLTDTFTYSSAMDFAMLIEDNKLGLLVGGTSGNRPDAYGDCLYFQMPNSKLAVSVSYKKWYRIDLTKSGEPLTPDYEVPSSEALKKVYELIS